VLATRDWKKLFRDDKDFSVRGGKKKHKEGGGRESKTGSRGGEESVVVTWGTSVPQGVAGKGRPEKVLNKRTALKLRQLKKKNLRGKPAGVGDKCQGRL